MPIRRDAKSERLDRIEALVNVIAQTTSDTHALAAKAEEGSIRRRRKGDDKSRRARLAKKIARRAG